MANLVKSVMLKIVADDADAEVKLDRISEKADELAAKHPELKVRIDAAEASAKMAVLRAELRATARDAENAGGRGGLLGKLLVGSSGGGGLLGAGESFAGLGTALINPITIALAALAAILSGPLIAALLPITAGFATFGLVGVREVSKVWAAVSQGGKALKALSPQEKAMVGPIESLQKDFRGLAKAVQPEIIKGFGTGLKIIRDLMPALTPLAVAAGKAFDGFLKNIQKWIEGPSGQKFIKWLETDGPKAIETFGKVLWDVAQGIGRTFSFLRNAGDSWFRNVHNGIDTITKFFTRLGHDVEAIFNMIKASYNRDSQDVNNWASNVVRFGQRVISWFAALPGKIVSFFAGLPGRLLTIGENIIQGLINGIEAKAGQVASAIGRIASSIPSKIASFLGIGSPSRVMYQHGLWIAQGLQMGMDAGRGGVAAAAARMAGATLAPAGGAGAAGGGGRAYTINVSVPPTANPAELGRQVVNAIRQFEIKSGPSWRK